MFNEKIFLFLWFWFFMVSVVSFFSLCHWMLMSFLPGQHMKFVRRYLRATDLATDRQSVKKFVHKFLGADGVFCMRMISGKGDKVNPGLCWSDFPAIIMAIPPIRLAINPFSLLSSSIWHFFPLAIAHAGDIMATELIVELWHSFNDRVRKSPIEMFEGGVSQSPSKMEASFKTWLLGQNHSNRYGNSIGSAAAHAAFHATRDHL